MDFSGLFLEEKGININFIKFRIWLFLIFDFQHKLFWKILILSASATVNKFKTQLVYYIIFFKLNFSRPICPYELLHYLPHNRWHISTIKSADIVP